MVNAMIVKVLSSLRWKKNQMQQVQEAFSTLNDILWDVSQTAHM